MKVFFWLPCSLPNYQQKSHFSSLDKVWSLSRQLISAMPISEDDFGFAAWAAIVTSEKRLSFPQLCQFLRPRRHGAVASKRWENVDHNRRLVQPFGTPFPKRNPAYGKVLRGLLMGEVWWKYMEIWWRMRNECCGCMFHPTSKGLSWVLNQCNGPWRCLLRMGEAQDHFFEDNILMFLLNEWQQEQVFHGITWPWSYLCQKIAETLITPIPQDHMKPVFAATRLLAWPGYSPISVVCKVFSIFDTLCIVRCRRENSQLHLPSHYNLWKHLVVRSQLDSKFYPKETIMWYLSQKSHDLPDVLLSIFVTSLVIFSVCVCHRSTQTYIHAFSHTNMFVRIHIKETAYRALKSKKCGSLLATHGINLQTFAKSSVKMMRCSKTHEEIGAHTSTCTGSQWCLTLKSQTWYSFSACETDGSGSNFFSPAEVSYPTTDSCGTQRGRNEEVACDWICCGRAMNKMDSQLLKEQINLKIFKLHSSSFVGGTGNHKS